MADVSCQLKMPNMGHLLDQIRSNLRYAKRMVRVGTHTGQSVAICGSGPSLALTRFQIPETDQVWACNSALPYLIRNNHRVTHGFCIDQGSEMLEPQEWGRTYRVHYLLGTTVHPDLVKRLRSDRREISWFHSFQGLPDPDGWYDEDGRTCEMTLYQQFGDSVQVGYGLNSVPRAVCLALAMGFDDIQVYGADCAFKPNGPPMPHLNSPGYGLWLRQLVMYADGRSPEAFGTAVAEAVIDGRRWHTRPDMVISAQHLLDLVRDYAPRITLVGDTLPNVFAKQPPEFFDDLPKLDQGEFGKMTGFGIAPLIMAG